MGVNHQTEGWFTGRRHTHRPPVTLAMFLDELDLPDWMNDSVCAQTDPDAFFPEKGGSTREAKKVCLSCDVRLDCLDCLEYAMTHEERFGIWGGLSERERRKLAKRRLAEPAS